MSVDLDRYLEDQDQAYDEYMKSREIYYDTKFRINRDGKQIRVIFKK